MDNLLTYLFDVYAGDPNWLFWRWTMVTGGLMLAIAIATYFIRSKDNFVIRLIQRLRLWGWVSGLIIFLLASFRLQNLYWLSMRFWIFAWLTFIALWLLKIGWWWFHSVPKARLKRQENQKYQQYLPSRK